MVWGRPLAAFQIDTIQEGTAPAASVGAPLLHSRKLGGPGEWRAKARGRRPRTFHRAILPAIFWFLLHRCKRNSPSADGEISQPVSGAYRADEASAPARLLSSRRGGLWPPTPPRQRGLIKQKGGIAPALRHMIQFFSIDSTSVKENSLV